MTVPFVDVAQFVSHPHDFVQTLARRKNRCALATLFFPAELLVLDFGGDCEERGVLQNGRSVKKLWNCPKAVFRIFFFRLVSGT